MDVTETVGSVTFKTTYDGDTEIVSATQVDPVTVVSIELLHEIMTGNYDPTARHNLTARVVDNRLILELANGTWIYQLGEYNPAYRGIMARLIEGEPMAADPARAG